MGAIQSRDAHSERDSVATGSREASEEESTVVPSNEGVPGQVREALEQWALWFVNDVLEEEVDLRVEVNPRIAQTLAALLRVLLLGGV